MPAVTLPNTSNSQGFADLVALFEKDEHGFDARQFEGGWSKHWVVYSDLVGFGQRLEFAKPGIPLNNLARFHHAVRETRRQIEPDESFILTDAHFAFHKGFADALRYATRLHAISFAHNMATINRTQAREFHRLIVPRTCIAFGNTLLDPTGTGPTKLPAIIGDGIVKAYHLEKSTPMGAIRVAASAEDWAELQVTNTQLALKRWLSAQQGAAAGTPIPGDQFHQSWAKLDLVDKKAPLFPWILASASQSHREKKIRAASTSEIREIAFACASTCQSWSSGFHIAVGDFTSRPEDAKHGYGFARWVVRVLQARHGAIQPQPNLWRKFWDPAIKANELSW